MHMTMYKACRDAIHKALKSCDSSQVCAISVSGQQHGLVVLDADKEVIRPAKLWCDVESSSQAEELSAAFNTVIVPSYTITKLLWLKQNEPENYSRIRHILLPHDYVNFWLTGNICMEASDASGTGFLNPKSKEWFSDRISYIDKNLITWLPETLLGPDSIAGTLTEKTAMELNLPAGIPVAAGGGDNAMSALGAGSVQEGVWNLSLGTSGTLFGPWRHIIEDSSGAICPFLAATGQALPLICTMNCTGVLEEMRNTFSMEHSQLAELAASEPAGSLGLLVLPFFTGERTPNWPQATGVICGLRPGFWRPGLIYRASLEGVTFSLFNGFQHLKNFGIKAEEIRLVGGGSKNIIWAQIIADIFQLPVQILNETETAALGAAFQAAAIATKTSVYDFVSGQAISVGAARVQPNLALNEVYSKLFERYDRVSRCLSDELEWY